MFLKAGSNFLRSCDFWTAPGSRWSSEWWSGVYRLLSLPTMCFWKAQQPRWKGAEMSQPLEVHVWFPLWGLASVWVQQSWFSWRVGKNRRSLEPPDPRSPSRNHSFDKLYRVPISQTFLLWGVVCLRCLFHIRICCVMNNKQSLDSIKTNRVRFFLGALAFQTTQWSFSKSKMEMINWGTFMR